MVIVESGSPEIVIGLVKVTVAVIGKTGVVGVKVGVGGQGVGVAVLVLVAVGVGVDVGVGVWLAVGVLVDVPVGETVCVGVVTLVGVLVGVKVDTRALNSLAWLKPMTTITMILRIKPSTMLVVIQMICLSTAGNSIDSRAQAQVGLRVDR